MATRSSPITVGRDAELARIDDARRIAATGQPVIVLIRGEAGIGKTRLIADAIERARSDGSAILHGACLDLQGEGLPYLPIVEAIRNFVRETPPDRVRDLLGAARADLAALIPEVAALGVDGPAGAPSIVEEVDRARLFERLLGFLDRLGADAPGLAIIEDVQWIDPATHDLVTFLVRNVTRQHVVAVLTCRTDDLSPGHPVLAWLSELGRAPTAIRIDLGRLSRADVRRQLEAMAGKPVGDELVRSIWRRSEGHPLFAEELMDAAADAVDGAARPPSLIEMLLNRVARLDEATLSIVRTLAVAGGQVDERLIGPIVGRTASEIGAALREATTRGVLTALPDGRHAFRHELLREIVERELTMAERRELHEGFARQLESRPELADERPAAATAELARHWTGADRPMEAHQATLAAAEAADTVRAFGDAHRQFERAIALEPRLPADALPDLPERIAIRRRAATAADLAGVHERAVELTREAIALNERQGDATTAGLLHARLAYLTWAGGDPETALEEHRRAVELVPAEPPSPERAGVLGGLGGALMGLGRWAESSPICEAAIACAVECGATPEESKARTMLGSDLVALGRVDAGLDELRRAHRLAGSDPTELFVVTGHNLGLNLLATDHLDEALAVANETRGAARDGGLERRYGMDLAALAGDILSRLGRWDGADEAMLEGIALDQRGHGTDYLVVVRARLLARRGQIREARRRLDAIDRERLEPDLAVVLGAVSAEAHLLDGQAERALAAALEGIEAFVDGGDIVWGVPLLSLGLRAAAERAEALRAERDDAGIAELMNRVAGLRELVPSFGQRVVTPSGRAWLASAAAETGRLDGLVEPEPWRAAYEAWDAAHDPAEAAYARFRFAETELRRSGVKAAVAPELVSAWHTSTSLGAVWLRAAIEVLARRARIGLPLEAHAVMLGSEPGSAPPPAPAPGARDAAPGHGLSAREIEVLRLVAAGRSNGEIGDQLFITRKTAGVHVTHILDKLGVSNRVEAAMAAARLGLIEPEDDEPGARAG